MILQMQASPNAATAQTRPDLIPCCSPKQPSGLVYICDDLGESKGKFSVLDCIAFAICLLTANSPANLHPLF